VIRALGRLPDEYRRVLLYRYQDGMTFPEIAGLLGRSTNAVQKLWARAVERLQQELETPS
jgi:RNA polymerase sigma-70 factor (ECF subfamily)